LIAELTTKSKACSPALSWNSYLLHELKEIDWQTE
jgi:hypothetical protein